jgi:hypothetical protein
MISISRTFSIRTTLGRNFLADGHFSLISEINFYNFLYRTALIALLFLYFCLRTNVQCHENSTGPHSHYFAIKQKATTSVPLSETAPDIQTITALVTFHPQVVFLQPSIRVVFPVFCIANGILRSAGCIGERAPPAC